MLTTLALLATMAPAKFYDFKAVDIDGKPVALKKYKGKVVMVVNVASKCGLTPQYEGLEKLYKEYKSKGLVVLGFPANEFNGQEPGTEAEIKSFCTANYGVTFPMMSKVVVKGAGQAPLYKWLVENSDRPTEDVEWNFAKFIIDREGKVIKRIKPQVKPESPELRQAIEDALSAK